MSWPRTGVHHGMASQEVLDGRREKDGAVVCEDALGCAMTHDGASDGVGNGLARGKRQDLKGDEPAAVVVDDAQEPDGDDAKDEDDGEVGAPELLTCFGTPWRRTCSRRARTSG